MSSPVAVPTKNAGEVFIPALGKSFQQIELREDDVHDAIFVPSGTIAAGAEYVLFRDIQNKNEQHTSLGTSKRIPAGDEAAVFRIGVYPRNSYGNAVSLFSDLKKVVENGALILNFNKRQITIGPLIKYQSGYGISGYSDENAATAFTVGVASAAAAPTLFVPQQLLDNDDITGKIRFPDAQWLNSQVAGNTSLLVYPVLGAGIMLSCFLRAVIKSPLGK